MLHDLVRLYISNLTKNVPEKRKVWLDRYVCHYISFLEFATNIIESDGEGNQIASRY